MIRKAVIPIAGLGSRLRPLSQAVPKAMFPLPHPAGLAVPVVHWICAEAAAAGVSQAILVVSPSMRRIVEQYFAAVADEHPLALPERIQLIVQEKAAGFGHAVLLAAAEVGEEPFLLMLGDHVYAHINGKLPCAAQVASAMAEQRESVAMIGVQPVRAAELANVGVVRAEFLDGQVYRCRDFVEKPDLHTACSRLVTPGLPEGEFLAHCGIYAFGPQIFDCLSALAGSAQTAGGEIELADAQSMLLERHGKQYLLCRIEGQAYDTGTAVSYAKAFVAFARG